jgi:CHAT domain-containing protein
VRRNATLAGQICAQAARDRAGPGADNFRHAEHLLDEADRAAAQAGPELQADAELARAVCLIREQRRDPAEAVLRRVLEFARVNHLLFQEGSALVTLTGQRYYAGHAEDGVAYSKEALEIGRRIGSDLMVVRSLNNLGLCYTTIGDYDSALEYLKQAESLAPKRHLRDDIWINYTNLGNIYFYLHDYGSAVRFYTQALGLARQLQNRSSIAILLANLGEAAMEQGDIAGAERFNAEALRLKRELKDETTVQRSEVLAARILSAQGRLDESTALFQALLKAGEIEEIVWESHSGLADIYRKQKRAADAEREFRAAISVVEKSKATLKLEQSRITFQTHISELYNGYVAFLAESGRKREALLAADRSRATTLAQRIGRDVGHRDPDPQQLSRETRSVLVSYWLGREASFLWVTTSAGVEQFRLPPQAEIEAMLDEYQRVVESPRDVLRDASGTGAALWRILIGPAQRLIPRGSRVLLVADRGLHRLNFETLIAPDPFPHFWIEDVTITVAPSFGALRPTPAEPAADSILLMGDPAPASQEFPALANSATEIAGISALFPDSGRVVLTGAEATPPAYFQSNPSRFRFIHFAAHATANRVSPLDSAVVFAPSGQDFRLYARDLAKAPLNADLVTISACRSAGARAYAGEGLVGFTWAFLGAGARNVIAGLWKVEDASTSQVMLQLYRELRLGRAPAEALRDAKLGLLRSGTAYRRPFYWAPFLLYTRVR